MDLHRHLVFSVSFVFTSPLVTASNIVDVPFRLSSRAVTLLSHINGHLTKYKQLPSQEK
jgi:hypothetical protein